MNDEEIKLPLMDGKLAYYICNMSADELCKTLKKEVKFGVLIEVIQMLNTDMIRSVWREKNDR